MWYNPPQDSPRTEARRLTVSDTLPFHQWLKKRRKALDLTHEELARHAGCSSNTLRKLESGERRPSRQLAERLADQLRISPQDREQFLTYARTGLADSEIGSLLPPVRLKARSEETSPPASPVRFNVPRSLTRLIGRDAELQETRRFLMDPQTRLVTLLGPAGVGKTRLALELASSLREVFRDGVVFVPLAALREPDLVASTLVRALGLKDDAGIDPAELLSSALRDQHLLVIFDNFEQVVQAGRFVAHLLAACPHLHTLITSRIALVVRGEQQVHLKPLALPNLARLSDAATLQWVPSIMLFTERVRAVLPGFTLNDQNVAAVAAICARLDGLPLAIELVAARSRILSPQMLLQRFGGPESPTSLDLLTRGSADLPKRHQTLRNAIDWSYQLLSSEEQRLLARLGCFVGSWTLEAAEAVYGDQHGGTTVVDMLQTLIESSLVDVPEKAEAATFTMLETIREYALERLNAAGEAEAVFLRHATYYCQIVEQAGAGLTSREQMHWLAQLDQAQDNVRVAIRWALSHTHSELAGRFGAVLWRYWGMRGHYAEGRRWLEQINAARPAEALRAVVLRGLASFAHMQRDYPAAQAYIEEAIAIMREQGEQRNLASALVILGNIQSDLGHQEAAILSQKESLSICKAIGETWGMASTLNNLATSSLRRGDYQQAREWYQEAFETYRSVGNERGAALALGNLGSVCLVEEQYARAEQFYRDSTAAVAALKNYEIVAHNLEALARAAAAQRHAVRAARLLGAADSVREALGMPRNEIERRNSDETLAMMAGVSDALMLAKAAAEGREMTFEQAVAYAVGVSS